MFCMAEAKRLRLFVALELPGEWRDALAIEAKALETAAPGFGRWVDPALMHITLAFLGYQEAATVPVIEGALREAAAAGSFALQLGAAGSFGGRRSLRVVWVGVTDRPAGALARLHQAVAARLQEARVSFDPAPFRAHVTLGRARRDATSAQSEAMYSAIGRKTAAAGPRSLETLEVSEIALMRSALRPTGPIYTALLRVPIEAERRD
jgi:2'-5' RNA ligase